MVVEFKASPPAGPEFRKKAAVFLKGLSDSQDFLAIGCKYGFGFVRAFRTLIPLRLYSCEVEFGGILAYTYPASSPANLAAPCSTFSKIKVEV